jgi:PHD/YefM family antitoxin component YafN of YafNO toxin-antitoxin module
MDAASADTHIAGRQLNSWSTSFAEKLMSMDGRSLEGKRKSLDVGDAARHLAELHRRVIETRSRIELTREGAAEPCVLISKSELECLERALEILGDSEGVRQLSGEIALLAFRSNHPATPVS